MSEADDGLLVHLIIHNIQRRLHRQMNTKTKLVSRLLCLATRGGLLLQLASVLVWGMTSTVLAQGEFSTPNQNLEVIGVPPIPAALARQVAPYLNIYGLPLADWDPDKREIWLKGLSSVSWVSHVTSPGARPSPSSIYIQVSGIYDLYRQPQSKYLAYTRDSGGNETFQLYLYDIGHGRSTLLSDGKSRNTEPVWSNAGEKIVYSSTPIGESGVNLRLIDPFDPKSDRLIAKSSGSYFKAYDWSPDDKQIVFCDFTSNTTSALKLIDITSGKETLLSPKTDAAELYDFPQFSKDGKGVYVLTDHDSDTRRVAYIDLTTRQFTYVPSNAKWDADELQLAPNGKTLALVTNEDGISRLHIFDFATNKEQTLREIPIGIISDLKWRRDSTELAFNFKSPHTPNDVYSVNVATGKVELWARSVTNGVDTKKFSEPQLIQ